MTIFTPIFTIRFILTKFDLLQWRISQALTPSWRWLVPSFVAMIVALSFTLDGDYASRSFFYKFVFFNVMGVFIFVGIIVIELGLILIQILLRPLPGLICEHVIEIGDRGLLEATDQNETLHKWAAITKCTVTRRYVYVHLNRLGIHIIPRKFFPSDEALTIFRNEIEKRMTSH